MNGREIRANRAFFTRHEVRDLDSHRVDSINQRTTAKLQAYLPTELTCIQTMASAAPMSGDISKKMTAAILK